MNNYNIEGGGKNLVIDLKVMCSRRPRIFFFLCTDNINLFSFVCRSLCDGLILETCFLVTWRVLWCLIPN